jgi:hypothetical protein
LDSIFCRRIAGILPSVFAEPVEPEFGVLAVPDVLAEPVPGVLDVLVGLALLRVATTTTTIITIITITMMITIAIMSPVLLCVRGTRGGGGGGRGRGLSISI